MSRQRSPWTKAEYDYLRANHGKKSHDEMARELGRGKTAVIARITRLKLRHHWTKQEDDFLRTNRRKKWVWCAKALGMNEQAVRSRAARLGIELYQQLSDADLKRLRELYDQGLGTTEMARRLNCSLETPRKYLRLWGLPPNKRNEKKRVELQRQNFVKNYGVHNPAQARKVRARRARLAAFEVQVASMAEALTKAEGNAVCPAN